uniref:Uncharacterized protein n=1 Tax=Arundo donax TaxID=35708 RepID=A0A0A9H8D1_ARUDO
MEVFTVRTTVVNVMGTIFWKTKPQAEMWKYSDPPDIPIPSVWEPQSAGSP